MAKLSKKELRLSAMEQLEPLTDCGAYSYTNKDGEEITNGTLFKGYAMISSDQEPILDPNNTRTTYVRKGDGKTELIVRNVAIKFMDSEGEEHVLIKTAKMTENMCLLMSDEGDSLDIDELYYVYVQEVPATDKEGAIRPGMYQHFVSITPFTDNGDGATDVSFAKANTVASDAPTLSN